MRAAKVQASLRIRALSPEPSLLAHTSSESRGTFRQKARSLAPLNGWACAVKVCHDGMLEDTNSLDGAHKKCMTYTDFDYLQFPVFSRACSFFYSGNSWSFQDGNGRKMALTSPNVYFFCLHITSIASNHGLMVRTLEATIPLACGKVNLRWPSTGCLRSKEHSVIVWFWF